MTFVYVGLVGGPRRGRRGIFVVWEGRAAFAALVFFLVFRQGRATLRDAGPKNEDRSDPNNSQWRNPKN